MRNWICALPLINLEVQPRGEVLVCCHPREPSEIGHLHKQSLLEIFNSEKRRAMAREFLEGRGERVDLCRKCVEFEKLGLSSPRLEESAPWGDLEQKLHEFPLSLGIRFSNKCNFACRTCRPSTSTGWYPNARTLNPSGSYSRVMRAAPPDRPISSQVAELLDHGLRRIYFAGGEPLLEPDHYRTLEIVAEKKPDCFINYNTNLSVLSFGGASVIPLWNKLKNVSPAVSLDGFGPKGEYIRKGLRWEKLLKNWDAVREQAPHVKFVIAFTLNMYNVFHLLDFFDYLLSDSKRFAGIEVRINYCIEPRWLNIRALPAAIKERVRTKYGEYLSRCDHEPFRRKAAHVLRFIEGSLSERNFDGFKAFTLKLDRIRGESFHDTFPELAEAYDF